MTFSCMKARIPDEFRPPLLVKLFPFFRYPGVKAYVYGGMWRDWLALGHNDLTPDIDVQMDAFSFRKLPYLVRKHFRLMKAHKRYLGHMVRPGVRLRRSVQSPRAFWVLESLTLLPGIKVGLTVSMVPVDALSLLEDTDLGFCQAVDDGDFFLSTPQFWRDIQNKEMTVLRYTDLRDLGRTLGRVDRFRQSGRYEGWDVSVSLLALRSHGVTFI